MLDETVRLMTKRLGYSLRFANNTKQRCLRRSNLANEPPTRQEVPRDPADTPTLRAALDAGVDLLVTNDVDLLSLSPYEGLKVLSMTAYFELLENEGLL